MTEDSNSGAFDLDRVRALIELMIEHDLGEVDLRNSDNRIRLRRGGVALAPVAPVAAPAAAAAAAASTPTATDEEEGNFAYVTSPMIGTFYSRPNPNSEPYVKVGDYVDKDSKVCIIEAMKVMNELPAEISGRVVAMLVDDEEPVDVGKKLFKIELGA